MQTRLALAATVAIAVLAPSVRAQPIATDRLEAMMFIADQQVPLISETLQITIDGQHATTTLLQVYQYDNDEPIEGRYRLRPGSGSHIEGFAYWNGEAKIVGEVFERQTARAVYENVTSRRRDPGLLEEDGEGAFAFKIFPIQPNEKKRVELRWTKWLERRAQAVRYRAPISRPNADIVITLAGPVKNLRSPSHRLHVEKLANGGMRVRSAGATVASGELVLDWEVTEGDWIPSAFVQRGIGQHDGWFALSLAAPEIKGAATPKDVTIVIDRSGSMSGAPIEHARQAAANMIRILDVKDRVNVVAFSDEVDPLFAKPQALDAETRARAITFVDQLVDGGGTDIALALGTAIKGQDRGTGRPRVVVFMTDGQSDIDKAIAAAKTDTGDVRLFTVGLGKDVNKSLLARLAAEKRGRFVYIEKPSAIEGEVGRLAASIAKPLLVDVSVDIEGVHAVRLYPRTLPDLFAQDELLITGRLRGTGTARFVIRGKLAGKPVAYTRTVNVAKSPGRPWVGRLWAQARVAHLLEEIALGASAPELQDEVLELALAYNFVTPYTAFLAIPESELGDQRDTVMAARERKKKILADNPDVATLDANRDFGAAAGGVDTDDEADGGRNISTLQGRKHGCAGCSTDGGGSLSLLVVFVLVALFRRRRPTA
jgi:Ca-activated chloride channel family protein